MSEEQSAPPKVLIVNFAGHNYSDARNWGEFEILTDGYVRPDLPDRALFELAKKINDSKSDDWLVPSGMLLLNILAALAFYEKHGKVKLLIYDNKRARKGDGASAYREMIVDRAQLQLLFGHFDNVSENDPKA